MSFSTPVGAKVGNWKKVLYTQTGTELGPILPRTDEKEITLMKGGISIWNKAFSDIMLFLLASCHFTPASGLWKIPFSPFHCPTSISPLTHPTPSDSILCLYKWFFSSFFLSFFSFLFLSFFFFLGLHPWHMEVPRLGFKSELQLPAYTTATITQDPSHNCDLHHSSQQCHIPFPLSEARDRTHILMDTSR